jgi:hypothetical protein
MDYNFLLNAWKEYDKFKAILSASAFLKMLLHRGNRTASICMDSEPYLEDPDFETSWNFMSAVQR